MKRINFKTTSGFLLEAEQTELPFDSAFSEVFQEIDTKKGAIFSSGFDYPGRHSRWEVGFVNPALEFISKEKNFSFNALNEQGTMLISLFETHLKDCPHIESLQNKGGILTGKVIHSGKQFSEEERSKQPSIFSVLRKSLEIFKHNNEAFSHFGFYGAFGYDLIFEFEEITKRLPRDETPDCHLFLPLEIIVVDRKKEFASKTTFSVETPLGKTGQCTGGGKAFPLSSGSELGKIVCDHESGAFAKKVEKVIAGTKRGDYFEVVLSQSFSAECRESPTKLFKKLSTINPSPYLFLINFGKEQLIGSSPEIYVRITGKRYETCPIAGTARRGESALEDADKILELLSSKKDESELTMCTDVDRNDMARVCVPGTVKVIGRRQIELYSHLIHTVDHVEGTLAEEYDSLDAFQSHMWACTVTGAPKPAAVQEIENLEASPRGWYSGAVGFLCFNGDINTGITLRTAHLKDGQATIRAGATLLYESDPALEEEETRTKAAAFLSALVEQKDSLATKAKEKITLQKPKGKESKVLLIDCRDSFVHNLASYIRELGLTVVTHRAGIAHDVIKEINPNLVLLSPGPGTPQEFGIPETVGFLASNRIPTFGVCLGHQGIGEYFGAKLSQLPFPEHGKSSKVIHAGKTIFKDIPSPFEVGRYHSLYLEEQTLPDELELLAWTTDHTLNDKNLKVPMAIRHTRLPIVGLQFHPESLMTLKAQIGLKLIRNILDELLS